MWHSSGRQKAMIQWVGRLIVQTQSAIIELEEELQSTCVEETREELKEQHAELVVSKKVSSSIVALLRGARMHGFDSDEFRESAGSQCEFLSMAPAVATNVFPTFIRTSARRSVLRRELCVEAFWHGMMSSQLGDGAMALKELEEARVDILYEKVVIFTEDPPTLKAKLKAFFANPELRVPIGLSEDVSRQCTALGIMAQPEHSSIEELEFATKLIQVVHHSLLNALSMSPAGRKLFDATTSARDNILSHKRRTGKLHDAIGRMQAIETLAARLWDPQTHGITLQDPLQGLAAAVNSMVDSDFDSPADDSPGLMETVQVHTRIVLSRVSVMV